jgi:hypothetical protein
MHPNSNSTMSVSKIMQASVSSQTETDMDASVSLAAKQLKVQIDESIEVYRDFYRVYEKETSLIKYYVNDDVLQRTWQQKVQHNSKYKSGQDEEYKHLGTQRNLLSSCLAQVNAAQQASTAQALKKVSHHDRRHVYLDKIRAAGERILRLAEMSMSSRKACADLCHELSDLQKLVDPENQESKILYRFDKRQTQANSDDKSNKEKEANVVEADGCNGSDQANQDEDKAADGDIEGNSVENAW